MMEELSEKEVKQVKEEIEQMKKRILQLEKDSHKQGILKEDFDFDEWKRNGKWPEPRVCHCDIKIC